MGTFKNYSYETIINDWELPWTRLKNLKMENPNFLIY